MKTKEKDTSTKEATLTLKLKADSGYISDQQCRISADQWGEIQKIIEKK